MSRGDQASRQWRTLYLLVTRNGRTVEQLQQEFGCGRRTVWRDLQVLQAAGFPITTDRDGKESRYRFIDGALGLPPIPLTLPELLSLHMGRSLLAPLLGTPIGDAIESGLDKIAATLTPKAKAFFDALVQQVSAHAPQAKDYERAAGEIGLLQEAIRDRRTVETDYYSSGRDAWTHRRIDPLHLWYQAGGMYLAGFCHRRREVRAFAVERFRKLRCTGEGFELPAGFDLERFLAGSFGLFRGRPVHVVLRFSKAIARYIHERQWHPTQVLAPLLSGELEIALEAPVCPDLLRWILGYGKEIEVLEPPSLRQTIRREWLAALRGPGGRLEAVARPRRKTPRRYQSIEPTPALAAAEGRRHLGRSNRTDPSDPSDQTAHSGRRGSHD